MLNRPEVMSGGAARHFQGHPSSVLETEAWVALKFIFSVLHRQLCTHCTYCAIFPRYYCIGNYQPIHPKLLKLPGSHPKIYPRQVIDMRWLLEDVTHNYSYFHTHARFFWLNRNEDLSNYLGNPLNLAS